MLTAQFPKWSHLSLSINLTSPHPWIIMFIYIRVWKKLKMIWHKVYLVLFKNLVTCQLWEHSKYSWNICLDLHMWLCDQLKLCIIGFHNYVLSLHYIILLTSNTNVLCTYKLYNTVKVERRIGWNKFRKKTWTEHGEHGILVNFKRELLFLCLNELYLRFNLSKDFLIYFFKNKKYI